MKSRYKTMLAATAFAALTMPLAPAQADTAAEIRLLKERLKQLEKQVAEQERKQKTAAARPATAAAVPAKVCKDGPCEPPPMPPPVWVSFTNGLKVESYDKDFSFKLGGRIYVDAGVNSEPSVSANGNASPSGQVNLRRARLSVEGKAFKYWDYKFEYDFTGSGIAGIRDAYIAFKHPALAFLPFTSNPVILQVGNFKEPQSLDQMASANNITFIERALPADVFYGSRHVGGALIAHDKHWSAKVGIFSTSLEDPSLVPARDVYAPPGSIATGGMQYFDVVGRLTIAPIREKDMVLHIGGSGRYQKPNSSTGANDSRVLVLGPQARTEANVLDFRPLLTPDLSCGTVFTGDRAIAAECTRDVWQYGAELAGAYGPFSFQGEYFGTHYNRNANAIAFAASNGVTGANVSGGTSLNFNGFYVYGSWFLTGESRAEAYTTSDLNGANFGAPKILNPVSKGGWGAWEVAARYSQINLNNGGILGGRQEDVTVGVNWYLDKGFRLMANWVGVTNLVAPVGAPSFNTAFLNNVRPNIFLMRAQVNW